MFGEKLKQSIFSFHYVSDIFDYVEVLHRPKMVKVVTSSGDVIEKHMNVLNFISGDQHSPLHHHPSHGDGPIRRHRLICLRMEADAVDLRFYSLGGFLHNFCACMMHVNEF